MPKVIATQRFTVFLFTTHTLISLSCHRQAPEALWKETPTIEEIVLVDKHIHTESRKSIEIQEPIFFTDLNISAKWSIIDTTPSLSISPKTSYISWNQATTLPKHLAYWTNSDVELVLTSSCEGEMWWKPNDTIYGVPNISTFRKIHQQVDNTWRIFIPVYKSLQHIHIDLICGTPQQYAPKSFAPEDILWQESVHTYRKDSTQLPGNQIIKKDNQIQLLLSNSIGSILRVYQRGREDTPQSDTIPHTEFPIKSQWNLLYEQAIYEQIQHSELTIPSPTIPTEFRVEIDHGNWSQIQDIPIRADVSFHIPTEIHKNETTSVHITTTFSSAQQGVLRLQTPEHQIEQALTIYPKTDIKIIPTQSGLHTITLEINRKIYTDFFWVEFDKTPIFTTLLLPQKQQWISSTNAWKRYISTLHTENLEIEERNTWTATAYPTIETQRITQKPQFLRLGDTVEIREYTLFSSVSEGIQSTVEHKHIHAHTVGVDQTDTKAIPVILSPNDKLVYQAHSQFLANSSIQQTLPLDNPISKIYFTSDDQYSEQLISVFFTHLFEPHSIENDALYLYALSTIWNNIANRHTPWHNTLIERARTDRDFLISRIQSDGITEEDTINISWALLASTRAGIIIPSMPMSQLLKNLCACADTIETKHLRWLLANSYWKHQKCGEGVSIFTNPQTKQMLHEFKYSIENHLRHRELISTPYQEISNQPHWMWFVWWDILEQTHNRYNKFSLTLQHNQEKITSGVFHAWQNRNISTEITTNTTLHATGSGRLHWSLWQIIPTNRTTKDTLHIERKIFNTNNQEIDTNDITLGSQLEIQYTIHSLPNHDIILQTFPSAGFSNATNHTHSITIHTDEHGIAHSTEQVVALFAGQFSFPAPQFILSSTNATDTPTKTVYLGKDETIRIKRMHPSIFPSN